MKVQTIEPAGFKPITLSITIESLEELQAIHMMTGADVSIPRSLVEQGYIKEEHRLCITSMFREIYNELTEQE